MRPFDALEPLCAPAPRPADRLPPSRSPLLFVRTSPQIVSSPLTLGSNPDRASPCFVYL